MNSRYPTSVFLALTFASILISPLPAAGQDTEDITQTSFGEKATGVNLGRTLQIRGGAVLQSSLSESWSANLNVDYQTHRGLPTDLSLGVNFISSGGIAENLFELDLMQTVKLLSPGLQIAFTADHTDNSSFAQFGIEKSSAVGIGILDIFFESDKAALRGFLVIMRARDQSVPGTVSPISGSNSYTYTAPQLLLSGKHRAESGILVTADLRTRLSVEDTSYTHTTFDTSVSFPISKKLSTQLQFGVTHYSSPPVSTGDDSDITSTINIVYHL